jgi:hypothetical protein
MKSHRWSYYDNFGEDHSKQTAMKMTVGITARLGRRMTCDEELEQSCVPLLKNLISPLPYRITKATGSRDPLSHLPVHAGARDGVDYGDGASSERWQNLDRFPGVCGGSWPRVYRGATEGNLSNMGHTHAARPSRLHQPTIRERPIPTSCDTSVKDLVKYLVFLCIKR